MAMMHHKSIDDFLVLKDSLLLLKDINHDLSRISLLSNLLIISMRK
jgi:hypothetical protein